ncbi:MAG TPA: dihydrolipoyllysine-residue succinyltransferase, partial [Polyangia bacterium]|nr:dihydrolipoyllysine-residue succinyltransferase [Polyangia bacterium]
TGAGAVAAPAAAATSSNGNGGAKKPAAGDKAAAATLGQTAALGQPSSAPSPEGPKVIGGVVEQMAPAPRSATVPAAETAGHESPATVPHSKTLPPSVRKAIREGASYETPSSYAAPAAAPQQARGPQPPPTVGEHEEAVAMSPLRKRIAQRLVEAQHTAAILTTFNEVDMTNIMSLRAKYQDEFVKRHGIKVGFMSFFVRACVESLKLYPGVNAEIRGDYVIFKKHYDFGIAVGGGKGLVVPVVRNVDQLSLAGIEKEIARLAGKAKDNTLTLDDLSGGTFSISNGGIYGSMMSTPLLNMPQTGILGMHNITKRPIAVGDAIELRPMMYIALSYDHRVVDGREAVQFLVGVKERLENPERLILEV